MAGKKNNSEVVDRPAGLVQHFIRDALKRMKRTPYSLAREIGWSPRAIYRRLDRGVRGDTLEIMLAACEAEIVIDGRRLKLKLREGKPVVV